MYNCMPIIVERKKRRKQIRPVSVLPLLPRSLLALAVFLSLALCSQRFPLSQCKISSMTVVDIFLSLTCIYNVQRAYMSSSSDLILLKN